MVLVALVVSGCSPIPPPDPVLVPDKILFIGSGQTFWQNGLDYHLPNMASTAYPPLKLDVEAITMSEATLQDLWEAGKSIDAIRTGDWDVVVLQETTAPYVFQSEIFPEYVQKFNEEAQQAGARTVLYMPRGSPRVNVEDISSAYNAAAENVDATVAPVALAWQQVEEIAPDLRLYDTNRILPNIREFI